MNAKIEYNLHIKEVMIIEVSTMLEIKNLQKSYGKKEILHGINLTIENGDLFGFIGANGAGKTTTIKCVCGINEFESGEIFINKKNIKDDPIYCKSITAYIPDNPDMYEYLTGIQYLSFIADIYNISKEDREKDINRYASLFELDKVLGDLINSYSHGMKQKLALISALIRKPKLLILDEPFVGLDPKASHTVKEIMKDMCAGGASIFFSTHVLEVAEKLCNKIAIIKDGNIVASGEIEDVKGNSSLEEVFLSLADE